MAQPDTKELDALLAALNRSAERLQTLWFSFLALTIYFAVTALTTTHRMLLLEEPQTLPILNMKVPLLPFFVIAPFFYVVIHFYMLMMMVLLARTTGPFEEELRKTFPIEADRERYRMRSENALFLQLLIGAKRERNGLNGRLLAAIAIITLAIAPVLVLVLMQMMFLPYHSLEITWWHRAMVITDFLLVTTLWTSYRHHRGVTRFPILGLFRNDKEANWAFHAALRFSMMIVVSWMTLWEGRWAGEDGPIRYLQRAHETFPSNKRFEATQRGAVFWMLPLGGFPDRLLLADEIIVGQALLEEKKKEAASRGGEVFVPTRIFDGRDLQAAVLRAADLRGVALRRKDGRPAWLRGADLSRAQMQGANAAAAKLQDAMLYDAQMQGAKLSQAQMQGAMLSGAQLQGADLAWAQMRGAYLIAAQLQGANLSQAQMQGTDLARAQMQGADLELAQMQGAMLYDAQLQGANLSQAQMQGAVLEAAQLQGANLSQAQMQGAVLEAAQLQGADLSKAQMQGADLERAQMQGANLSQAQMQGANLSQAKMQGADLAWAQMQGADLTNADIDGANLSRAQVQGANLQWVIAKGVGLEFVSAFRAAAEEAEFEQSLLRGNRADAVKQDSLGVFEPLTPNDVAGWREMATRHARDARAKKQIDDRFYRLEPGAVSADEDNANTARWSGWEEASSRLDPDRALHRGAVAGILGDLACDRDITPFLARRIFIGNILRGSRLASLDQTNLNAVRDRMKKGRDDPKACPGVIGFTDADWQRLDAITPRPN